MEEMFVSRGKNTIEGNHPNWKLNDVDVLNIEHGASLILHQEGLLGDS